MEWSAFPLAAMVAAACIVAAAMLRRRQRVEPGLSNDESLAVQAKASASTERDLFDWESEAPGSGELFNALRNANAAPAAGNVFVAVAEIDRFATLRHSIGYRLSSQVMGKLAERIVDSIEGV